MSMDSLCITNISTLPASPSKEPVFILSSDQLQEIISHAITQALEEMQGASPDALNGQEKLQQLIEGQAQEIKALKSVIQTLLERAENQENTQERMLTAYTATSPRTGKESRSWKGHQSPNLRRETGRRSSGLYWLRTAGRCSRRTPGRRCISEKSYSHLY